MYIAHEMMMKSYCVPADGNDIASYCVQRESERLE